MASLQSLKDYVDNITKCPICRDDLNNPKLLPCQHTFCLHCLEKYTEYKHPGDDVECPVCRAECQIPESGVAAFRHNHFIPGLVNATINYSARSVQSPCDVCTMEANSNATYGVQRATLYCVDCSQKLCVLCSRPLKHMPSGSHNILNFDEWQQSILKQRILSCEQHQDRLLVSYCFDCKALVCGLCRKEGLSAKHNLCDTCCKEKHAKHKIVSMEEAARGFGEQIESEVSDLSEIVEFVKQIPESHRQKLESDHIADGQKEKSSNQETYELVAASISSFVRYVHELVNKGSPCEVVRGVDGLLTRIKELRRMHNECLEEDKRIMSSVIGNVFTKAHHSYNATCILHD